MELEVKPTISIADGLHTGVIEKIEYRTDPYNYTDVIVKVDGEEFTLKWGAPTYLSEGSKLFITLKVFDPSLKVGDKVDPESILKDKKVSFMTLTEAKGDKKYARIVDGSLKPVAGKEDHTGQ